VFADEAPLLRSLSSKFATPGPGAGRREGLRSPGGEPRRGFLERAARATTLKYADPWGDDLAAHRSLVLIGEGFRQVAIRRQLWACPAPQN